MSPFTKQAISYIGTTLSLIGLIFIALKLYSYGAVAIFSSYSIFDWTIISGLVLVYTLANILLSIAWWHILSGLGINVSYYWAVRTYAISQITKYLPGNIFQFVGRQALGMAKGLPTWLLAKSSFLEILFMAFCCTIFGVFLLPVFINSNYINVWICLLFFLLIFSSVFIILRKYLNPKFINALLCYIGFLVISSLLFLTLIFLQNKSFRVVDVSNVFILCSAYIVAWFIGLITPGAPAGVGVRELVLLFILNGIIEENNLLSVILLGRLITIGGDVFFYIILASGKVKIGQGNV
ncbi:lysylphosphatidylglycerol synthase domain-containing protein [Yersinia frederiksenii]|uniref:lysylphosphatidylglycerol synthase domain-containing protein n=1 Tax=Yersinia frederiksenii TaxID=29484 RepID=UPI0005E8A314|nr:lysylphosphatidylglycerol synthase domain-containing protein [Yersinia frederiksenii]CNF64157.1 Uncharacterised protein family (UPF0104) [Yersinia frederiksenii]